MMAPSTYDRTELPSGVKVLTERLAEVRSVSLGVWIDTGSRDEAPAEQGLSHFLEHMLFKGTPSMSALEIAEAFDHIGADINAATGREHTSIYSRVLEDYLERDNDMVMDMARHSMMKAEEIDSERQVVLEEINMHNDSPDELVHDHIATVLWGDHPIGHTVLGTADVIKNVGRDFLLDFYRDRYVASRIVVAAAGAVDHDRICDMVAKHLNDLPAGEPADRTSAMAEPVSGKRIARKDTEQAHIVIGGKGLPRKHPDRFALSVMDNILGGSMSSRLFQRVREQLGLVYSIYSYNALFIGMGMVGIYAGCQPSSAARVISLIEEELSKVRDGGFSPEEMARAKNHIKGSLYISNEDSGNRMNRIAKAELSGGEHLTIDEMVERVESVSIDDIHRVFAETWDAVGLSLAVIGPFEPDDLSLSADR
jgi:predicted Zn-dependent peptidase